MKFGTIGRRLLKLLDLLAFLIWQMIVANWQVALDVLTPGHNLRPAILAIQLDARSDAAITMLANIITLTPGSLSLDISSDRRILYVHLMYAGDIEMERERIKTRFERRVLEVLNE